MNRQALCEALQVLIGQEVDHLGYRCEIIEVLEDSTALVLRCSGGQAVIQPDQYGEPRRLAPLTFTVPVLTHDGEDYHPDFLALDLSLPPATP
jgi:hypothetical protein